MKRLAINCALVLALLGLPVALLAQDTLSLPGLLRAMQQNNNLYRLSPATDSVYALRKVGVRVGYRPRVNLNAEATWQSDVTHIGISLPGISLPQPNRDSYSLAVDATQLVWDGGAIASRLKQEESARQLEHNRVDNELYALRDRIATLYFGLLSIDMAIQQLRIMEGELDRQIAEVKAGVSAGVMLESSLIALQAERLRLAQSVDANLAQRSGLEEAIHALTGVRVAANTETKLPTLPTPASVECNRPDYRAFDLQQGYLAAASEVLSGRRMPTLSAFARVGYGKPALNMLSDEFGTYAVLGARLSWNIWDWNSTSNERQSIKIQQNIMEYRRSAFNDTFNSQVKASLLQISSLERQILSDERIVQLLGKAVQVSASQLRNGTITSATYLSDFSSLLRARVDMGLRRVKLSHEQVKLYFTMGLEIID